MLAALRGDGPLCRLIGAAMPRAPWSAATRLGNTTSSVSNSPRFATVPATAGRPAKAVGALNSCRQRDHIIGAVLLSLFWCQAVLGRFPSLTVGYGIGHQARFRPEAPRPVPRLEGIRPAFQPMDVGGDVPEQFLCRRCQPPGGPGRARWRSGRAGARTEVHAERPCWFWSDANTCRDPWASVYPQPISTRLKQCPRKRMPCGCGQSVVHLSSLPFRGERGPCPGYLCMRGKFRRVATNQGGPMHDRNLTHTILFSISCGSESPAGRHRNLRLKTPPDHPATAPSPR